MFKSLLTPEQWAEARRLRGEGATFVAIGKQFAVDKNTIATRAKKEGWPSPSQTHSKSKASLPADTANVRRAVSPAASTE